MPKRALGEGCTHPPCGGCPAYNKQLLYISWEDELIKCQRANSRRLLVAEAGRNYRRIAAGRNYRSIAADHSSAKGCQRCQSMARGCRRLCLNKQEFRGSLHSQEGQCLLSKYAHRLASELQSYYSYEMHYLHGQYSHQWTNIEELLRCKVFPVVCPWCGHFECDHGSACNWFCGEGRALQQVQDKVPEEHRVIVENMGPCGCNKTKQAQAGHRVCACQHCNIMPLQNLFQMLQASILFPYQAPRQTFTTASSRSWVCK